MEDLLQEIISSGAIIGNVEVKDCVDSGMGIFAAGNLCKGDNLLSVPYSNCFGVDMMLKHPQLQTLLSENEGLLAYPDEVMAIGLMYGLKHCCPWQTHVKSMPKSFNTMIYWSEKELLELKENAAFHIAKMMNSQIQHDFDTIHHPISMSNPEELGHVNLESYKWALSIVYSRAIEITRKGETTRVIVPILDMANHNPFAADSAFQTFHYDDNSDTISLLAASDLKQGEECCAVYGFYPNSKLLLSYGFVVQGNPHRAIDLWTKVSPSTYAAETKIRLLQSHELTKNQTYDFKGTICPGYISPALLATIRVIQADDSDLQNIGNAFENKMVSLRNEQATYVSLRNLLLARMKLENAEADRSELGEMLLNDTPLSNRLLCALIVRVEERELLQEVLEIVNEKINSLAAV